MKAQSTTRNRAAVITLLLILFCVTGFSRTHKDSTEIRINTLIKKKKHHTISKEELSELLKNIFAIQNKGFKLGRQLDYKNSIKEVDKAMKYWIALQDSLSEANLRKYKSVVLAQFGRFDDAICEGHRAILLYDQKDFGSGKAVAEHDLSIAFDLQEKPDSALWYETKAKAYFLSVEDSFRITACDIHMVNIHRKMKAYNEASELQLQLESQKNNLVIYWEILIDYYYVSQQLYRDMEIMDKANLYETLYQSKLKELSKTGIITKSIYEQGSVE